MRASIRRALLRPALRLASCCGLLLTPFYGHAWQSYLEDFPQISGYGSSVEVDPAGDLFAGGHLFRQGSGFDFTVAKLTGADGSLVWTTVVLGTARQTNAVFETNELALDVALSLDAVIAVGRVENKLTAMDMTVVKLSAGE